MCNNVWDPAPRIVGYRAHFSLSFAEKKEDNLDLSDV